jgi:hypothetical protein
MWCKVLDSETLELDFGIEQSGDFAVGALRDDSVKFSESFGMVPGEVTRIKGIKSIRELFGGAVLVFALDEVLGEGFEGGGSVAERFEGDEGVGDQFLGVFEGLVDAEDGRPGRFRGGGVLAGGFA